MSEQAGLKPTLLIASPQLQDPFFERSLVLLWHHDADGAMGVIINRPVEHSLQEVLALDDDDLSDYPAGLISWGGPVETDSGTVVTSTEVVEEDGWNVGPGLYVTRSQEVLTQLLVERLPMVLCLGYAGWGPGQLDKEIEEGGWLFADVDADLVLSLDRDDLYERALATLGLTPHTIWMAPADA